MTGLYILLLIVIVLLVIFIVIYNTLVTKRNRMREGWSDIEVQLKRRYDLIPNLVSTVQGYAAHEKEVFEKVTEARANVGNAQDIPGKIEAENQLSATLKTLFAVAENYPQLKASDNFMEFQKQLEDTENKIQAARRFYNSLVMDYNIAIQVFPSNIAASAFSFKSGVLFNVPGEEEQAINQAPKVNF